MTKNQQRRICADCKNFKCHNVADQEYMELESGTCKATDEVVYGDDEFAEDCEFFKSGKRQAKKHW